MFEYTFAVKDWNARKFSNIKKAFSKELNVEEIRYELGLLFDTDLYKNVMIKKVEQIDENGKALKINWKKWI